MKMILCTSLFATAAKIVGELHALALHELLDRIWRDVFVETENLVQGPIHEDGSAECFLLCLICTLKCLDQTIQPPDCWLPRLRTKKALAHESWTSLPWSKAGPTMICNSTRSISSSWELFRRCYTSVKLLLVLQHQHYQRQECSIHLQTPF